MGPAPSLISDETGAVNILYPEKFGEPEKWQQTKTVTFFVSHPEYVSETFDLELEKWPDEITNSPKVCRSRLLPKDRKEKACRTFFPMVGSDSFTTKWNLEKKSVAATKSLKAGEVPCLVVAPNDGQPLFSQPTMLTLEEGKVNRLDVQLRPGKKVYGEFPSIVPRPIQNGSVHLHSVPDFGKPLAESSPISWDSNCDVNGRYF